MLVEIWNWETDAAFDPADPATWAEHVHFYIPAAPAKNPRRCFEVADADWRLLARLHPQTVRTADWTRWRMRSADIAGILAAAEPA